MRDRGALSSLCGLAASLYGALASAAFVGVNAPTSQWTGVRYPDSAANDPINDNGTGLTGQGDSDLIGNATHPVFYSYFDAGDPKVSTDGTLYFRARLGGKDGLGSTILFENYLMVGIDLVTGTAARGKLDLFAVCNSKKKTTGVYLAGTGLNTSPNTSTISGKEVTGTLRNHVLGTNYSTLLVDTAVDDATPRPLITDLDVNSATDYFVSFSVSLADIILGAKALQITVTDATPMAFAVLTATQDNSFNQDILGIGAKGNGATDPWNTEWSTILPTETTPVGVPEPGLAAAMLSPFAGVLATRRSRRGLSVPVTLTPKMLTILPPAFPAQRETPDPAGEAKAAFRVRLPAWSRPPRHKLDGLASLDYF